MQLDTEPYPIDQVEGLSVLTLASDPTKIQAVRKYGKALRWDNHIEDDILRAVNMTSFKDFDLFVFERNTLAQHPLDLLRILLSRSGDGAPVPVLLPSYYHPPTQTGDIFAEGNILKVDFPCTFEVFLQAVVVSGGKHEMPDRKKASCH